MGQSEEPDVLVGSRIIIKALCISLSLRCDGVLASFLATEKNIILQMLQEAASRLFPGTLVNSVTSSVFVVASNFLLARYKNISW